MYYIIFYIDIVQGVEQKANKIRTVKNFPSTFPYIYFSFFLAARIPLPVAVDHYFLYFSSFPRIYTGRTILFRVEKCCNLQRDRMAKYDFEQKYCTAGSRRGVRVFHPRFRRKLWLSNSSCLPRFQGNEFSFRVYRHGTCTKFIRVVQTGFKELCVCLNFISLPSLFLELKLSFHLIYFLVNNYPLVYYSNLKHSFSILEIDRLK